jgi:hypothetical protein
MMRETQIQIGDPSLNGSLGVSARMNEKSAIRLFTWKKAIVIILFGIGTVLYKTYQSYQQKGHLDLIDFVAGAMTIVMMFCIVAFVGWWANR